MLNADSLNQLRQLRNDIKAEKTLYAGTVKRVTNRFGFVTLDEGRDAYLPQEQAQRALINDRVQVSLIESKDGKPTAELEAVDDKALDRFIGQYQVRGKGHFVAPDVPGQNRWLFVPPQARQGARHGDYVHCRVSRHPFPSGNAQAEILAIIGHENDPGIERAYALARYGLADEFPETVEQEVAGLDESLISKQRTERDDLTDRPYVTIDAPSTMDMDDALWAQPTDEGWLLSVAVADPAALLPANGATEREARARASAGYFPGNPRAMLPPRISQDLGSLVAGKERLALVVDIPVKQDGSLGEYRIRRAVIRSRHKLAYDDVSAWLEGRSDDQWTDVADDTLNSLSQLGQVADVLRRWREENALLNDERPDYRIRLNEERRIRSLEKRYQSRAHKVVEEAMIAANRCTANFLIQQGEPALFITHAGIRQDRLANIRQLLEEHAQPLSDLDPDTPEGFAQLVRRARALESDLPIKAIVMRQLERAELAREAAPHQGMGLPAYTTMTSPLRKYLDYFVHRLLHAHLTDTPRPEWTAEATQTLQEGQRTLRQAVNSTEQALKARFAPSLGSAELEGEIVQVNPAGFMVRLEETGLTGFVAARELQGKHRFDPVTQRLIGDDNQYQLEQRVQVRFKEVDKDRGQIRFTLV